MKREWEKGGEDFCRLFFLPIAFSFPLSLCYRDQAVYVFACERERGTSHTDLKAAYRPISVSPGLDIWGEQRDGAPPRTCNCRCAYTYRLQRAAFCKVYSSSPTFRVLMRYALIGTKRRQKWQNSCERDNSVSSCVEEKKCHGSVVVCKLRQSELTRYAWMGLIMWVALCIWNNSIVCTFCQNWQDTHEWD